MKKGDYILLIVMMVLSLVSFIPLFMPEETAGMAVIEISGEEVARLSLEEDRILTVEGTNGPITVQVQDGKIGVVEETSARHICSYQGFVDNPKIPIICLPNETIIRIESSDDDGPDVIIQ